jgi:UDP-MurNAc hydroxylase
VRIVSLGHAGLMIEVRGKTLLCDPWLSETGAFDAAWMQYPCNHHLAEVVLSRPVDFVYVSHEHADHFDEAFLARLPKSATILAAAFLSHSWRERLKALGFAKVRFLKDFERVEIAPGLEAVIVHAPSHTVFDSAFILKDVEADQVLVNLNDCKLNPRQIARIKEEFGKVDAAFGQFSGASWFPMVYDLPEVDRIEAAQRKVQHGLARWARYVRALDPTWASPNSGPPTILDPAIARYRDSADSIFPDAGALMLWLEKEDPALHRRTRPLLPGDALDLDRNEIELDAGMHKAFDWYDAAAYLDAYAERARPVIEQALAHYPEPAAPLFPAFKAHFEECIRVAPNMAKAAPERVLFEIEGPFGGSWLVNFAKGEVSDLSDDPGKREDLADYAFAIASHYIPALVDGSLRWEDFFLSFRFRAWRPSIGAYNEGLMAFLRFAQPRELLVQENLTNTRPVDNGERFRLETPDGAYKVQLYCPHMGQELAPEDYDPATGILTCPRHGWSFRIPGGACLNAVSERLNVEPVAKETAGAE